MLRLPLRRLPRLLRNLSAGVHKPPPVGSTGAKPTESNRYAEAARAWRSGREASSEAALVEAHRMLQVLLSQKCESTAASSPDNGNPAAKVSSLPPPHREAAVLASERLQAAIASSPLPRATASPVWTDGTGEADLRSQASSASRLALETCRRVGRWADVLTLFESMRRAGLHRDACAYEHALTSAMVLERFDLALALWQSMSTDMPQPLRPSARAYNAAMSALERSGRAGEALALYKTMEVDGVAPDSDTVHVVISACEREGDATTAVAMLGRLEAVGLRPPSQLYVGAMRAAAASADGKRAEAILSRMRARGVPRSASTYAAAIAACDTSRQRSDGTHHTASSGHKGNRVARGTRGSRAGKGNVADSDGDSRSRHNNSGIPTTFMNSRRSSVISVIDSLLGESPPIVRAVLSQTSVTTAMLHACALHGRPKEALALLDAASDVHIDRPGLNTCIDVTSGERLDNRSEIADGYTRTSFHDGMHPLGDASQASNAVAASTSLPEAEGRLWRRLALRACAAGPFGNEARAILGSLGTDPPLHALKDAICASAAGREWRHVLALFEVLHERLQNSRAFSSRRGGLDALGEVTASVGIREDDNDGTAPSPLDDAKEALSVSAVAAITAHGKLSQLNLAANVFHAIWPPLIAELGSTSQPVRVSSETDVMPRRVEAYNALLMACLDCNDPQRTLALLAAMRAEGASPNALSLTAAITAAQRLGQHDQVLALVEELHKPRVSWRWRDAIEADAAVGAAADAAATPRVFGGLGSGIGRADDLDLAISSTSRKLPTPVHHLDKEISDSGPPLTTLGLGNTLRVGAYNGRLTACLRDGQLTRAVALFEEMGVRGVPKNSHTLALGAEAMASLGEWLRPLECIALIRRRHRSSGSNLNEPSSATASATKPGHEASCTRAFAASSMTETPPAVPASTIGAAMGACVGAAEWRGALALLDPSGDAAATVAANERCRRGGDATTERDAVREHGRSANIAKAPLHTLPVAVVAFDPPLESTDNETMAPALQTNPTLPISVGAVEVGPLSKAFDDDVQSIALRAVARGAVPPTLCAAAMAACVNGGQWQRAIALFDAACEVVYPSSTNLDTGRLKSRSRSHCVQQSPEGGVDVAKFQTTQVQGSQMGTTSHARGDKATAMDDVSLTELNSVDHEHADGNGGNTEARLTDGHTDSYHVLAGSASSLPLLHAAMLAFEAGAQWERALKLLFALGKAGHLHEENPHAPTLLSQAVSCCSAARQWAPLVQLLHLHGGNPALRSTMLVRSLERTSDIRQIDALLCARRATMVRLPLGAAPSDFRHDWKSFAGDLKDLVAQVQMVSAIPSDPDFPASSFEERSGHVEGLHLHRHQESGIAATNQPSSQRPNNLAGSRGNDPIGMDVRSTEISSPPLEGAELSAALAAFAAFGAWDRVRCILDASEKAGHRLGVVDLRPTFEKARASENWELILRLFFATSDVAAIPSMVAEALDNARNSSNNTRSNGASGARRQLDAADDGAKRKSAGVRRTFREGKDIEKPREAAPARTLDLPSGSRANDTWAPTDDWSRAASAGFAIELATDTQPMPTTKMIIASQHSGGSTGAAGVAAASAAAGMAAGIAGGPHGAAIGAAAGMAAGTAVGLHGTDAARLSRGAVSAVFGMSESELSTRAARDAASVVGASVAAGAAAAAAAGPHGAALGAVAGMAAGMARLHRVRAAAAAAALRAAESATMAGPSFAAAAAALAATPPTAFGGGALRRGRWWWDMRSYRIAMLAARKSGNWRAAIDILRSLREVPSTAFSKSPAPGADAASPPHFGDYATLRSLGFSPPPTIAGNGETTFAERPARAFEHGVVEIHSAHGRASQPEGEHASLMTHTSRQHKPDAQFYTGAIAACLADGSFEALSASMGILAIAERAGTADGPTYGAAMQAQVKLGRRLEAWRLLRRARARGVELITLELNIGLGAAARCGQLSHALALLQEMRRVSRTSGGTSLSRIAPDVGSYDALLFPLASAGRFSELLRLFDEMQEDGLAPIEPHYILALRACAEQGLGMRAATILLRMQARGMRYGRAAAVAMVACNRARTYETSLDIFRALQRDSADRQRHARGTALSGELDGSPATTSPEALHNPFRSVAVFNVAIQAMRKQGLAEEAVELVRAMRREFAVAPDHVTFGTALAACREVGEPALLTMILEALFQEVELQTAGRASQKNGPPLSPFLPSDEMHAELIGSFGRFGEPRRALRLFAQLLSSALPLHNRVFNRTLVALSHSGYARPHLLDQIIAVGHEREVWGTLHSWNSDVAVLDCRPFLTGAPMLAALHYWLRLLGRSLPRESMAVRTPPFFAVIACDGSRKEGEADERLQLISKSLHDLAIDHAIAGSLEARVANAALSYGESGGLPVAPGLILVLPSAPALDAAERLNEEVERWKDSTIAAGANGQVGRGHAKKQNGEIFGPRLAQNEEGSWVDGTRRSAPVRAFGGALQICPTQFTLESLLSGSAPADDLDDSLDGLARCLAPREVWLENMRRERVRRQAARERVLRERGLAPPPPALSEEEAAALATASARRKHGPSTPSRWPTPMPDGNVPWSTPRTGDFRPRDNVFRAARSRTRSPVSTMP